MLRTKDVVPTDEASWENELLRLVQAEWNRQEETSGAPAFVGHDICLVRTRKKVKDASSINVITVDSLLSN